MKAKNLAIIVLASLALVEGTRLALHCHQFTEEDLRSLIPVGMDEDEVFKKVGQPNFTGDDTGGIKILDYNEEPQSAHMGYAGFEVFVKDHKVVDVAIISGASTRFSN